MQVSYWEYLQEWILGAARWSGEPLEDACLSKGLAPEHILREIDDAAVVTTTDRDWETAPLDELVSQVVETQHAYLKLDLPVLEAPIKKGCCGPRGARSRTAATFCGDVRRPAP